MEKFKVYYGEYPLSHWLKLILNSEIELPTYQRNFVWDEARVLSLIRSFKDELFIPPVTIGTYSDGEEKKHYILDGQQRLSAVLLAYLRRFPDKTFEQTATPLANSDEDGQEKDDDEKLEENEVDIIDIKNWKLSYIQKISVSTKDIEEIRSELSDPKYKEFECLDVNKEFLENHSLGFAYIKPLQSVDNTTQKKYYSSIFRNINTTGMKLTAEESRSSLYWLDSKLEPFFKPKVLDNAEIDNNKMDFARYLAFVAEYLRHYRLNNEIKEFKIAKGYATRIKPYENYIENFVYHCVGENTSSLYLPFKEMFPDISIIESPLTHIRNCISTMRDNLKFASIIDADYYFFGLVFWVLFEGKSIDLQKLPEVRDALNSVIKENKDDTRYTRRPSSLGRIRNRIYVSIMNYKNALEG